jgi:hypothetical protein
MLSKVSNHRISGASFHLDEELLNQENIVYNCKSLINSNTKCFNVL